VEQDVEKNRDPDLEAAQEEDFPGSGGEPGPDQPDQVEGERDDVDDEGQSVPRLRR
jgi:hypothetical protein